MVSRALGLVSLGSNCNQPLLHLWFMKCQLNPCLWRTQNYVHRITFIGSSRGFNDFP